MIRVDAKMLSNMLEDVKPAMPGRRCNLPILDCVLVEANGKLQLTGTDLTTGIRTYLDLQSEAEFSTCVPFRAFRDIVRAACGELTLSLSNTDGKFHIQDAQGTRTLQPWDADDYPTWQSTSNPSAWVHVQDITAPLDRVIHAVSKDYNRHGMDTIFVNGPGGTIFATDRHRHVVEPVDWIPPDLRATIAEPKRLLAALKRCRGWVDIAFSENSATFSDGVTTVTCRMTLVGEKEFFPEVAPVSTEFHDPVRVRKADLVKGLKVCKVMRDRGLVAVELWFDSGSIMMKAEHPDLGYAGHVIDAQVPDRLVGKQLAFNVNFLMEAIRAGDPELALEISDDLAVLRIGEEIICGMRQGTKMVERPDFSVPVPVEAKPRKLSKKSRSLKKAA